MCRPELSDNVSLGFVGITPLRRSIRALKIGSNGGALFLRHMQRYYSPSTGGSGEHESARTGQIGNLVRLGGCRDAEAHQIRSSDHACSKREQRGVIIQYTSSTRFAFRKTTTKSRLFNSRKKTRDSTEPSRLTSFSPFL